MTLTISVQNPEKAMKDLLQHTRISGVKIMFEGGAFLALKNGEVVRRFEAEGFEVKNRGQGETVIFQYHRPREYWTLQREPGECGE